MRRRITSYQIKPGYRCILEYILILTPTSNQSLGYVFKKIRLSQESPEIWFMCISYAPTDEFCHEEDTLPSTQSHHKTFY